jgi:hypothetical protein
MRRVRRLTFNVVFAGIALLSATAAEACEPGLRGEGVRVMRSAAYAAAWVSRPAPIPVGAHFTLELAVCAAEENPAVEAVAIDAVMPEHRHGMNYRATVAPLGNGRYRAEGLLFHMPGLWRLSVELRAAGKTARLADEIVVE